MWCAIDNGPMDKGFPSSDSTAAKSRDRSSACYGGRTQEQTVLFR
jgi:hypothetical protein